MRAHARIVTASRAGRTVLATLRSDPPISLRATADAVYWVGSAAAPLGGDELVLEVEVAAGTSLVLRTAAAAIALAGAGGVSTLRVVVSVGEDAAFSWCPEPLILAAGAAHRAEAIVSAHPSAEVRWREEILLGRTGEDGGSCRSRLSVDAGGAPVLRHELRLDVPGGSGPAVLDGARAVGNLFACGPEVRRPDAWRALEPRGGVFPLGPNAVLATALAGDSLAVARALDAAADLVGRPRHAQATLAS